MEDKMEGEEESNKELEHLTSQTNPNLPEISLDSTSLPAAYNPDQVIAVIPAYNEERFIGSVVLKVLPFVRKVIVVDDGSSDETGALAKAAGAVVLRHGSNMGKGAAINTGLEAAKDYQPSAVVMLDADGQHNIRELPEVVVPILSGEYDIVIGSRYLKYTSRVPRTRIWGHLFFNLLTRLVSGTSSTDSQSGFRAFSLASLDKLKFRARGFAVESEMQFLAKEHKLRIKEVEITVRYDDKPKRSVIAHGLSVLNGILFLIGQYRPLLFFGGSGFITLLAGIGWGVFVVDIYRRSQTLAVGYAMISVLLTILGSVLFSTGIMLHSLRSLLLQFRPNS